MKLFIATVFLCLGLTSGQSVNSLGQTLTNSTSLFLRGFQWSQCGSNDHMKFSRLQVDPDPMKIPGLLSVGFDTLVKTNLTGPLPFSLKMKKKVSFLWIDIPCEHGFGSCHYPDFCSVWPYPKPCSEVYKKHGIPCSCPFLAKRYNLVESIVGNATLPFDDLPSWLEDGQYKITATLSDTEGNELLCLNINMGMKVSSHHN